MKTIGIVGARGYVGQELVGLVKAHGGFEIGLSVSARDGVGAEEVAAKKLDAYTLALPNGASDAYVEAILGARPDAVIVDISADHRFDPKWIYGQPDRQKGAIAGARLIANPGCFATAAQLALAPVVSLFAAPPNVFGVSGYSGAGTTPSEKNDTELLKDNLLPYSLVGHMHEREVAHALGTPIYFMPHVAPFFRGITVTASMTFSSPQTKQSLEARYRQMFGDEPMVRLTEKRPLVKDIANKHHVEIGGLAVADDGMHAVIVSTIDNLLGGAATSAVRNLNLALGFAELQGIDNDAASR